MKSMKFNSQEYLCIAFIISTTVVVSAGKTVTTSAEDDLPDFDFENSVKKSKENDLGPDYAYPEDTIDGSLDVAPTPDTSPHYNMAHFNYANRERRIRQVLIRALSNTRLRQKFVEVMPVLRMMSKPQRLTLAALIQAQVDGNRVLTLEQVKQLFGNREDLILPLILDIANLIKAAGEGHHRVNLFKNHMQEEEVIPSAQLLRRSFFALPKPQGFRRVSEIYEKNPAAAESDEEEIEATVTDITNLVVSNLRDSRMHVDDIEDAFIVKNISAADETSRAGRALDKHIEQKLALTYHERKMNMTAFNSTKNNLDQTAMASHTVMTFALPEKNMTMDEVEDMALASLEATTIMSEALGNGTDVENLPKAEPLIRIIIPKPRPVRPLPKQRLALRKQAISAAEDTCERFSSTVCISVRNYPIEQVMRSIKRHNKAMSALLADYKDKSDSLGPEEYFDSFYGNIKRQGEPEKGTMCESIVRFARPQKARSATGEWKYIVNTGTHTQTLRLEKCSTPLDSCSYLTDNYRSRCIQVYNYHRLLSWDATRGLHVDIFKVPTCCSCHIDGYKEHFPPLSDYTSNYDNFEFEDETRLQQAAPSNVRYKKLKVGQPDSDDDEYIPQHTDGYRIKVKTKGNPLQTSSSGVVNRFEKPVVNSLPILDEFLSPPVSVYDPSTKFNSRKPSGSRRRPNTSMRKEGLDQFSAESDSKSNEVTVLPPTSLILNSQRKRIPATSGTPNKTLNVKLQNAAATDTSKRVNYNYHPIIDFFGDEDKAQTQKQSIDRIGNTDRSSWRPITSNNYYQNKRRGWNNN